jgi:glycerol kinase
MTKKYILSLDQGTTSSRAILFDHTGKPVAVSRGELTQHFPGPGWVEHDPDEIWRTQADAALGVLKLAGLESNAIEAIGITNQRETTVAWNREDGRPVYNAIVWQDRRTAGFCDILREKGFDKEILAKTGLIVDAYFSAPKIKWILDNVPGARGLADKGKLAFGNVDSWLAWKLTGGKLHVTDVSNASRTMIFNIHTLQWDKSLLEMFDIPESILPVVKSSSEVYGTVTGLFPAFIPLSGIAGDQQAALFGHMCLEPGMVKSTFGTGCFMMMNAGTKPVKSKSGLLSTIAWKTGDKTQYALEGSIYACGSVVQWLRDGLGIIEKSDDVEMLAAKVRDNGGVYLVPAFSGLGAPYWDQHARGTITGLTRGSTAAHLARAALESIAYQTLDVLLAMKDDTGTGIRELRVDGGACVNDSLMQFQSDILQVDVIRPAVTETTALGAAYLAGLAVDFWSSPLQPGQHPETERVFSPRMTPAEASALYQRWCEAVNKTRSG